jgi:hypothetical protein
MSNYAGFFKSTFMKIGFAESGFRSFRSSNPSLGSFNFSGSNVIEPFYVFTSSQPALRIWETPTGFSSAIF